MKIKKLWIWTFVWVANCTVLFAQGTDNSPFSRLGLGDLYNGNLNGVALSGNLGSSFISPFQLNIANPGTYGFLDYTVLDVGLYTKYAQLKDKYNKSSIWSGNLRYVSLGFPLRNIKNEIYDRVNKKDKWGMNFSFRPYSIVNYNVKSNVKVDNIGTLTRLFQGRGGSYIAQMGTGYRYENFGIGANVGYLFGKIINEQIIDLSDEEIDVVDRITNNYNISGFVWNAGAIYRKQLNEQETKEVKTASPTYLQIGLRGSSGSPFKTNGQYTHLAANTQTGYIDTMSYETASKNKGYLAPHLAFGVSYVKGKKWSVGAEFENAFWTLYKNGARPNQTLQNSYKLSVGGRFTPDSRGFGSFLERTEYLFGAFYQTDSRLIDNKSLTNLGVTLGMRMPFFYQKSFSSIALGFELGNRSIEKLINENYIECKIGINFNDDQWFLKSRYN